VILCRRGKAEAALQRLREIMGKLPRSLSCAAAVLTAKDFIRLRLTNAIGWDETEAAVAPGGAGARDFDLASPSRGPGNGILRAETGGRIQVRTRENGRNSVRRPRHADTPR